MGPALLLDKSAFQKCPKELLPELFRHYSLVVPPILVKEILEDYAEKPKQHLALARRFDFMEIFVNIGYLRLCEGEMLGHRVTMQRQPCVAAKAINSDEGLIHILKESAEVESLRRWKAGGISDSEKDTASDWHKVTEAFDMEALKTRLRRDADGLPKFSGDKYAAMREVARFVDALLSVPDQLQFLELALQEFREEFREQVRARWKASVKPSLREFAPFTHHCLRVKFLFALALPRNLISSHHNSLLDLEYFYYLPFCQIFCSDDRKLHNVMQSVLLRPDQIFWDYGTFERALGETHFFFRNLTPDQMKKWLEKKGHYPPRGTFITRQMHKQFWNLPEELQQNFAKKLPQNLVDSVLRKVKTARDQM